MPHNNESAILRTAESQPVSSMKKRALFGIVSIALIAGSYTGYNYLRG